LVASHGDVSGSRQQGLLWMVLAIDVSRHTRIGWTRDWIGHSALRHRRHV
jgi:hypothetical protein